MCTVTEELFSSIKQSTSVYDRQTETELNLTGTAAGEWVNPTGYSLVLIVICGTQLLLSKWYEVG